MKISILADPIDEQSAGVHYYTKNLVEALLKIDRENEYILVHTRKNPIFQEWKEKTGAKVIEVIVLNFRRVPGWASLRKFILLSFTFLKYKPDVIVEPAHIGPFSFFWKCKKVVVIHDLTPILFPQFHIWISRVIHKWFLPVVIRNADVIIAASESTKRDIIRLYHPSKPVYVTHYAVSDIFKPAPQESIDSVCQKYAINKKYILTVGTLEPRKNLELLLSSFISLRKRNLDFQLVLVGQKGWSYEELFQNIENAKEYFQDIIVTGYVAEADLPSLYSGAEAFVYPSLYEGFGFPPLEAMQSGCPVICSNTSSLPEVVGEAGILIDPKNEQELTNALTTIFTDPDLRSTMRQKGFEQAQKFSWTKCAGETLDICTHVHESNISMRKNYLELIWTIAKTDFKLRYHGSFLGYFWSLLKPLLLFLVLWLVFGLFVHWDMPNYQLYLLLGIVLWNFFAEGTTSGLNALISKVDLIKKISFPRIILVIATTITAFLTLFINLVIFYAFSIFSGIQMGWQSFYAVPIIILLYFLILGTSLLLSALSIRFKDINQIWEVLLQVGFWLVPIVYPLTLVSETFKGYILLNPLARLIQFARSVMISQESLHPLDLIYPALFTGILLVIGLFVFQKLSPSAAEEL